MTQQINNIVSRDLASEILEGLSSSPKTLPCKLFYDERGSELFDLICTLDEYYLTRTEMNILKTNISEITSFLGKDIILIEPGSGNSSKTRLLFDNLPDIRAYIPVDISKEYLQTSSDSIKKDYPWLNLIPVCADFTQLHKLDLPLSFSGRRIVFYPGSTIGNFTSDEAKVFLRNLSSLIGRDGGLLIGVDLKKDKKILLRAYNDSKGVTAEFNLNILNRLNREFGADFNLRAFRHKALYNESEGRIEMYLISLCEQTVNIFDSYFVFQRNERILTEYSHKYTVNEFKALVDKDMRSQKVWTDKNNMFSIQYYNKLK